MLILERAFKHKDFLSPKMGMRLENRPPRPTDQRDTFIAELMQRHHGQPSDLAGKPLR
jgi:hypothetical protein